MNDYPVDIVYLWCDSSDSDWQKKKNAEKEKCGKSLDLDSVGECRFLNNDELKFSLRSLEKYAPWINNIFIVTDNQIPDWLDTSNPKVKIVNHTQILPSEALPTFNASAIESGLHRIPNLSEHFLFANDDMFFGKPVPKEFFFDAETGNPIFRFSKRRIINKTYKHLYGYMVSSAYRRIREKFGKSFAYFPHHNIDAYKKSDIEKCYNEFKEEFELTERQKFREKECVQRSIFGYYSIVKSAATYKVVGNLWAKLFNNSGLDSILIELKKNKLKLIEQYNPCLFCLNDSLKTTDEDRFAMKEYLKNKFPEKSSFEKYDRKNVEILTCYHKNFDLLESDAVKPIQVGADLSQIDLRISKDNTGDNISKKNANYCELTALYWLWKNSDSDYVGLMHYRRLFDLNCGKRRWFNKFPSDAVKHFGLTKEHVNSFMEDCDVVVTMKRVIQNCSSVYVHYKKHHYISDLDRILEIIQEKSPQIYDTAVNVLKNSNGLYLYNMFISTKTFMEEYSQWLFEILNQLELEIGTAVEQRDIRQQRVYGFLSERLFTIYVEYRRKNGLKLKEVPVVYCEINKKRYNIFQMRTVIYSILVKIGIRRPHWKEQYGV